MIRPDETVPTGRWSQGRVQQVIAAMLRAGVVLSAAVVIIGGILYLLHHGHEVPDYRGFNGEPGRLRNLSGVLAGAREGEARSIIQLGLLLLIATPVVRVAFTAWLFVRQRDRLYVAITLLVLTILCLSLFAPDWELAVAALPHR